MDGNLKELCQVVVVAAATGARDFGQIVGDLIEAGFDGYLVDLRSGYSYHGFCATVARAGCAGYLVSFPGKRVLYFGRSGDTHTEYFPGTAP